MENNTLLGALTKLPELLAAFDKRVGPYCGHTSTTKGITLKTPGGSLFLYHSFIHKLIHQPEEVNNEELKSLLVHFH
ncbi:hypothetical protein [Hufsiella ginkgonis]|uniref:Uncharacterized protein n=1 Tax=Hufsiella ginkgonis TaxID=2695274 RepID=A0A7K1XWB5_9SPHI|nr:hypothetical protein [Hufsiella ginkgonis]MXV15078.1 hypothetical protein [Hufsiella ginkgonis]